MRYRKHYGYSWRYAIIAEFYWRLEHWPIGSNLRLWAYSHRKVAERRGARGW